MFDWHLRSLVIDWVTVGFVGEFCSRLDPIRGPRHAVEELNAAELRLRAHQRGEVSAEASQLLEAGLITEDEVRKPPRAVVGGIEFAVMPGGSSLYPVSLHGPEFVARCGWKFRRGPKDLTPRLEVHVLAHVLNADPRGAIARARAWARSLLVVEAELLSRLDLAFDVRTDEVSRRWHLLDQFVSRAHRVKSREDPCDVIEVAELATDEKARKARRAAQSGVPLTFSRKGRKVRAEILRADHERFVADLRSTYMIADRRRLTSMYFGERGSPVMARAYDKFRQSVECQVPHAHQLWKAHGWDGLRRPEGARAECSIWRFEFELRRLFLKSWDDPHPLDRLEHLLQHGVASVWSYLTREWLRVTVANPKASLATERDERGRLKGCPRPEDLPTLPLWELVQGACCPLLGVVDEPAGKRCTLKLPKVDEGAMVKQAIGCLARVAAAHGLSDGELLALAAKVLVGTRERVALMPRGSDPEADDEGEPGKKDPRKWLPVASLAWGGGAFGEIEEVLRAAAAAVPSVADGEGASPAVDPPGLEEEEIP